MRPAPKQTDDRLNTQCRHLLLEKRHRPVRWRVFAQREGRAPLGRGQQREACKVHLQECQHDFAESAQVFGRFTSEGALVVAQIVNKYAF
jgi:hypothetical protein